MTLVSLHDIPRPQTGGYALPVMAKDCGIRAVANACGTTYREALNVCKLAPGGGMWTRDVLAACAALGFAVARWPLNARTLKTAIRELPPRGTFVLRTHKHFVAVVNGECQDFARDRVMRMYTRRNATECGCWRITQHVTE